MRITLALLTCVISTALMGAPAHADWYPELEASADVSDASYPSVAASDLGTAVVAWRTGAPEDKGAVWAAHKSIGPSAQWSSPVKVSRKLKGGIPHVAMDGAGRAIVVWEVNQEASDHSIWAAFYKPGAGWGKPVRLSDQNRQGFAPDVTLHKGVATVAYISAQNAQSQIHLRRRSASGTWGAAKVLSTPGETVGAPELEVTGSGKALVAYTQTVGSSFAKLAPAKYLFERHEKGSGGWSGKKRLSFIHTSAVSLAVNDAGDAAVLYRIVDPVTNGDYLQVRHRSGATKQWTSWTTLTPMLDYSIKEFEVSAEPDADIFTMVWWVGQGATGDLVGRRRLADGTLTPQTLVSTAYSYSVQSLALATADDGATLVVWTERDEVADPYAVRVRAIYDTNLWDASPSNAAANLPNAMPAVGTGNLDVATVVWVQTTPGDLERINSRDWDVCHGICSA